jgi:hypothetical protein
MPDLFPNIAKTAQKHRFSGKIDPNDALRKSIDAV